MVRQVRVVAVSCVVALALTGLATDVTAEAQGQTLATVRVPRAVLANGQALAAGTYAIRLTDEAGSPVVGQSPDGARWVEFVQAGQVRGRELSTVLTGDAVAEVTRGGGPASGGAKVELLKGGEYLRVWINRSGTHYLIHLTVAPGA